MEQVVGISDNSVVDIHHEFTVDLDRLVLGVLENGGVAGDFLRLGEKQPPFGPVFQVFRSGQECAADLGIVEARIIPAVAEKIKGILESNQAHIFKAVLAIFSLAKKGAVFSVLGEMQAVITGRHSDVADISRFPIYRTRLTSSKLYLLSSPWRKKGLCSVSLVKCRPSSLVAIPMSQTYPGSRSIGPGSHLQSCTCYLLPGEKRGCVQCPW